MSDTKDTKEMEKQLNDIESDSEESVELLSDSESEQGSESDVEEHDCFEDFIETWFCKIKYSKEAEEQLNTLKPNNVYRVHWRYLITPMVTVTLDDNMLCKAIVDEVPIEHNCTYYLFYFTGINDFVKKVKDKIFKSPHHPLTITAVVDDIQLAE